MNAPLHCNVALVRPKAVQAGKVLEACTDVDLAVAASEKELRIQLDAVVDYFHDLVSDVSEALEIRTNITSYQLFESDGSYYVMGRKRARALHKNDLIAGFDPDAGEMAFLTAQAEHPVQRTALGFSRRETILELATILGSRKYPLVQHPADRNPPEAAPGTTPMQSVGRVFALHTPLHEDSLSDAHEHNKQALAHALSFPHNPASWSTREHFTTLYEPDPSDPLLDPENRHALVDPDLN